MNVITRRPRSLAGRMAATVASFAVVVPLATPAFAEDRTVGDAPSTATAGDVVTGEVHRLVVDMRDGSAVDLAVVVPEDGPALTVRPQDVAGVATGATARVRVTAAADERAALTAPRAAARVADVTVVEEPRIAEQPRVAAAVTPARPVHVARATGLGTNLLAPVSLSTLAADITQRVSPYWSESTGGAISFSVASQRDLGVYSAWGASTTCTNNQIFDLLDWVAAETGATPGSRTHAVLYTDDPLVEVCGFAGVAYLADGGPAWVLGESDATLRSNTTTHELGHTLGVEHSDTLAGCRNGTVADAAAQECVHGEYGDAYDVMGVTTGGAGPLSGAQLDLLDAVPAGSMVTGGPGTTVTLAPVGGLTGQRFLKFSSGGRTYHVEYRGAVGRDGDLGTTRYGCAYGWQEWGCDLAPYRAGVVVRSIVDLSVIDSWMGMRSVLLDAGVGEAGRTETSLPTFVLAEGRHMRTADGVTTIRVADVTASGATIELLGPDAPVGEPPVAPTMQMLTVPDLTGDEYADVLTVDSVGQLHVRAGKGDGSFGPPVLDGRGWHKMTIYAPGDWTGDGVADLLARDREGRLWVYPGDGFGKLAPRSYVGRGWSSYDIDGVGDMDGDGNQDVLAIDSRGTLWLYPGTGTGVMKPRQWAGDRWGGYRLYAAADADADGTPDVLSIDRRGWLWFYSSLGAGKFAPRVKAGVGWGSFLMASGTDLDNDGVADLLGRDSLGRAFFYEGIGAGSFGSRVLIDTGW